MSNLKLSMSVERLPMTAGVPVERRGLLMARICVTNRDTGKANDITLIAEPGDTFKSEHVSAMLRHMAETISRKHGDQKDAA